jgi:hypothetical protein
VGELSTLSSVTVGGSRTELDSRAREDASDESALARRVCGEIVRVLTSQPELELLVLGGERRVVA